jgi:hypothetical protein
MQIARPLPAQPYRLLELTRGQGAILTLRLSGGHTYAPVVLSRLMSLPTQDPHQDQEAAAGGAAAAPAEPASRPARIPIGDGRR